MITNALEAGSQVLEPQESVEHAYYKYDVFIRPDKLQQGWSRDRIIESINQEGGFCRQGHCPEVYLEKAFENAGLQPGKRLPVAKELGETSMQFLVHPTLDDEDMHKICRAVKKVFAKASL